MKTLFLILLLLPLQVLSDPVDYFNEHFDIAGYVGWRFIYGPLDIPPIESGPEIGLMLNWNITDELSIFTQSKLDTVYPEQTLAYAFVNYDTVWFDTFPLIISAGKLRTQYGLYNEYRLNPRTRPGVVAPQSVYWDKLRYSITSGWGFSFKSVWENFQFKYSVVAPIIVDEPREAFIWTTARGTEVETPLGGISMINVDYITDDWRIAFSTSFIDFQVGQIGQTILPTLGFEVRVLDDWILSIEGLVAAKQFSTSIGVSGTIQYEVNPFLNLRVNTNYYEAFLYDPLLEGTFPLYAIRGIDNSIGMSIHYNNWELRSDIHVAEGSVWVDIPENLNPEFDGWWWYGGTSIVYHFD